MRGSPRCLVGLFLALLVACGRQPQEPSEPPEPPDYRIEFVYAVASDGEDRFEVLRDSILQSIRLVDDYLYELTGKRFRTDGTVRKVVLPYQEAYLAQLSARSEIERFLDPPEGTIVHAYYDGPHNQTCGHAAWPPLVPGRVSANYIRASIPPGEPRAHGQIWDCAHMSFLKWWHGGQGGSVWLYPRGYREWAMMHEVFHVMGLVPPDTPGSLHGHILNDWDDIMCCETGGWHLTAFLKIGESYRDALLASPWLR